MKNIIASLLTISLLISCVSDEDKLSDAESVIRNWIGYHNKHDYAKLLTITTDTLSYYGEELTKNELVSSLTKSRQAGNHTYQQVLGDFILDSGSVREGLLQFSFINRTIGADENTTKDVPTTLVVTLDDSGNWKLRGISNYLDNHNKAVEASGEIKQELNTSKSALTPHMENGSSTHTVDELSETTRSSSDSSDSSEISISEAHKLIEQFKNSKKTYPEGHQPGKRGKSSGTLGNFNYNLSGFGILSAPSIKNKSQDHGSVTIEVCLDKQGKIKSLRKTGGTSTSLYLKVISINAVKQFEFFPIGSQAETNCGTITFNYALH